jgi:predicted TIM-barrel fold metal-dependent hydrolase
MLDAGIQLEPERARLVQALSQTSPDQWRPEDVQRLKEGMDPAVSGIPRKRIFGSDYPYRDAELWEDSARFGAPPCCPASKAT